MFTPPPTILAIFQGFSTAALPSDLTAGYQQRQGRVLQAARRNASGARNFFRNSLRLPRLRFDSFNFHLQLLTVAADDVAVNIGELAILLHDVYLTAAVDVDFNVDHL